MAVSALRSNKLPTGLTALGVIIGSDSGSQLTITDDDARAIQREVSSVQVAAPTMRGGAQIIFGDTNWSTALQGVTPEFLKREVR
jgi:putative ABC transport system permease protein